MYALRLQYRVGIEGPFTDVLDEHGNPVEYQRNEIEGHTQSMPSVSFPAAALEQPYVQLVWRYYRVAGSSGPRAELRLDDIFVEGSPRVTANTGTPHWWLADQGLAPPFEDAAIQPTGTLNRPAWQYYVADIDPYADTPQWPSMDLSKGELGLRLTIQPTSHARAYQIWGATNLHNDSGWFPVTPNMPGTGTNEWLSPSFEEPARFYRSVITVPVPE